MYLDPGSWGMAVQVLVGALVAIPVLVGVYWKNVKTFFTRGKSSRDK